MNRTLPPPQEVDRQHYVTRDPPGGETRRLRATYLGDGLWEFQPGQGAVWHEMGGTIQGWEDFEPLPQTHKLAIDCMLFRPADPKLQRRLGGTITEERLRALWPDPQDWYEHPSYLMFLVECTDELLERAAERYREIKAELAQKQAERA